MNTDKPRAMPQARPIAQFPAKLLPVYLVLLIACGSDCPDSLRVDLETVVYPLEPVEEGRIDLRWSGLNPVNNEVVVRDLDGNIVATGESPRGRCATVNLIPGLYEWSYTGESYICPELQRYRTDWTPLEVVPIGSPDVGENRFPPCENGP